MRPVPGRRAHRRGEAAPGRPRGSNARGRGRGPEGRARRSRRCPPRPPAQARWRAQRVRRRRAAAPHGGRFAAAGRRVGGVSRRGRSGNSSKSSPLAANSTIIRSVIHSTGARSSVQASPRTCSRGGLVRAAGRALAAPRRAPRACAEDRQRCDPIEPDHDLVEAKRLPGHDLRELAAERPGDPLGEPVVFGDRGHIQRNHPARPQPVTRRARRTREWRDRTARTAVCTRRRR